MLFSCLEHSDAFVLFNGLNPKLVNKLLRPHITRSHHADPESSLISLVRCSVVSGPQDKLFILPGTSFSCYLYAEHHICCEASTDFSLVCIQDSSHELSFIPGHPLNN